MLKKPTSGVLTVVPDLRGHKLGPLRAVSAHVLEVCSVRETAVTLLDDFFDHTSAVAARIILKHRRTRSSKYSAGSISSV